MDPRAIVNGTPVALEAALISVTDDGFARGDGAFESIGVWDGQAFRLDDHLHRLNASLAGIGLPTADLRVLAAEAAQLLAGIGDADAMLRIYVTGSGARVLTSNPQPVRPSLETLATQTAAWIRPVGTSPLAGTKTMSYVANMAAMRTAVDLGADDALLLSNEGWVLEGPTFAVLWIDVDGAVCTPELGLGIVDSISRRTVLELAAEAGNTVREGAWTVEALEAAGEVMTCSSIRPLHNLRRIDGLRFRGPNPVGTELAGALEARRRGR